MPKTTEQSSLSTLQARGLLLLAVLMWSSGGLFAKSPVFLAWPEDSRGVLLAFWRALFASLGLFPFLRRPSWSWNLVPMTLCFLAMNIAYLTAMTLTTSANATWLQNTSPTWVCLISWLVLREQPRRADLVLLTFGILGVAFILTFEIRGASFTGVLIGLAGGLFYAGVVLFLRQLRGHSAVWLILLNHLVTATALLPVPIALDIWPSGEQLPWLAAFDILQMGIPYVLFTRGLQIIPGGEASSIALLEPIILPLWVLLLWGEQPRWWTTVGGALILTGMLYRYTPVAIAHLRRR